MTDQDIFQLAEFVGWKWHPPAGRPNDDMGRWEFKGMWRDWSTKEALPFEPLTDANDCNAVIKHLNGLDYFVRVCWPINDEVSVRIWNEGFSEKWFG